MKKTIKRIFKNLYWFIDIVLLPFILGSGCILKLFRHIGTQKLPLAKKLLLDIGIYPLRDHYYDPQFNPKYLHKPLSGKRSLPGIDWNIDEQLEMLNSFNFQNEFSNISDDFVSDHVFHFKNGAYESGDAEYWYNIIRLKQPKKIIEIGSGNSTKMARIAIGKNQKSNTDYQCRHM